MELSRVGVARERAPPIKQANPKAKGRPARIALQLRRPQRGASSTPSAPAG